MDKFEFKVDLNTPYIKTIRFIGTLGLGFVIGAIVFTLKFDEAVDWTNSATVIMCMTFFAFFPGALKKQSLTIDEKGIHLHNYTFHWREKKEITWEKVKSIGVQKNKIVIKNNVGSSEKINLPLHTKEQLEELKSYLMQISDYKNLEYSK
ncbi:EbsA family protein [Rhodohalobacter sp.]|uniref:EbsA family protein n=1 Tax=Rhodohalobacter sp. TaxID=1974210 RepID=UPI002ACDDADD|nr:EbsA family protein [Rhodohalobacter sp.]MDZ7757155.1 EbsA family protein [Rhodohalobacter sp.]